jgi:hypothetical protein
VIEMVKFRGKRLDNGKWIEGNYAEFVNYLDGVTKPGIQIIKQVPSSFDSFIPAFETELIEVMPETVGMGVEIKGKLYFEGDLAISVWYDHGELTMKLAGEIIFSEGWKCFCIWDGESKTISELNAAGHEDWALKNIGNKWDNSELGAGE